MATGFLSGAIRKLMNAEIQKHIDALELLLKWYSTPDELVKMGLKEGA